MMKKLYVLLFSMLTLFSCSTSNDDEAIPTVKNSELEKAIIGKWDVDNPVPGVTRVSQSNTNCLIFSFIFNSNGTFIINHRDGVLTGNYSITGEDSISLGNGGSLGYIEFGGARLFFRFEFPGLCERTIQTTWDPEFEEGACYSFLKCNDNSWWKASEGEDLTILNFRNNYSQAYFHRFDFNSSLNCKEVSNNNDQTAPWVVYRNEVNELKLVREIAGNNWIYTYSITEAGKLYEEIETIEGTTSRVYEPAAANELDYFEEVAFCGQKTFVPDDVFEAWLIQLGYDDIMDNYVLTENINSIEQFYISGHNNSATGEGLQSLEGLEDFTALKELEIQAAHLAKVDLYGNTNLERLFLGSPAITELDLSRNVKLNSLYFEFANVQSLDLSKNINLKSIELQLLPLLSLDISNNTNLEMLTIEGGSFKDLIAVEIQSLWHLNLGNNEIEQIDLEHFPNMVELILDDNLLTALDVSALSKLQNLEVQENRLTAINVSQNLNLYHFWANENPAMECIQVAQVHLDRLEDGDSRLWWEKDQDVIYSLNCQ